MLFIRPIASLHFESDLEASGSPPNAPKTIPLCLSTMGLYVLQRRDQGTVPANLNVESITAPAIPFHNFEPCILEFLQGPAGVEVVVARELLPSKPRRSDWGIQVIERKRHIYRRASTLTARATNGVASSGSQELFSRRI